MPRVSVKLLKGVAASVDAPLALASVLGDLFDGIDALGSMPRATVRELVRAGINRRSRVLDLACGKGAVGVEAVRRIGCTVDGIDACDAFITSARQLAARREVSHRCTFKVGDARAPLHARYDAAMMIGLFPLAEAARLLRACTKRGGVYLIDDCWWDDRLADPPNADCFTKPQSLELIASLGDRVERVVTPTPSALRTLNAHLYESLRANVKRLEREHARLRKPLRAFLANQRAANRLLGDVLRPALWIVRRS